MALDQEQIAFYARWLSQMGVDKPLSETPTNFYTLSANALKADTPSAQQKAPQATIAQSAGEKPEKKPARKPLPMMPVRSVRQNPAVNMAQAERDAQEQAEQASNLPALKKAMESFAHCDLKETAAHFVFGDGNPKAVVMFIGEAPGAEEDRQGIPFVGQAGLLDKMLAAIDLSRETTYLTNLIPWRPPGARNPTPEERMMFRPFLDKHIELVAPKIIVLLGAIATKELLGTQEGISKLRGKWQTLTLRARSYEVMPTFHPAFLMRQPSQKKSSWEDLQSLQAKIKELGDGGV